MDTYKKLLAQELLTGLTINAILGGLLAWVALPSESMLLFGGPDSASFGVFMAGIIFPAAATLIIPVVLRRKLIRQGHAVGATATGDWRLARRLVAAALLIFLSVAVIAPIYLGLMYAQAGSQWSKPAAWVMNMGYLLLITFVVIPTLVSLTARNTSLAQPGERPA